jgi:O-antigen ligase
MSMQPQSTLFPVPWQNYFMIPFCIVVSFLCVINSTHTKFFFILYSALLIALVCFFLIKKKIISPRSIPIFGFYILQFPVYFNGLPLFQTFLLIAIPSLPFLFCHFLFFNSKRRIPGSSGLFLMFIGFIVSLTYQVITDKGVYNYSLLADGVIFSGIFAFFTVFSLLVWNIISLKKLLMLFSLTGISLIVYIVAIAFLEDNLGELFSQRFGYAGNVNPNTVSCVLDLTFPLALFFAIYEKRRLLKIFLFAVSTIYCLCLLATASRGSLPGLLILGFYLLYKLRSVKAWAIVVLVTILFGGVFGGKVLSRLLSPSIEDLSSNLGRVDMVRSGFRILKSNYFTFGIGMDSFRVEKYKFGFSTGFDPEKRMGSHNTFLEFWLGWGILGLLGWLWFLIMIVIKTIRAKVGSESIPIRYSLAFSIIFFMIHSIFDSGITMFPFVILLFSLLATMSFVISTGESESAVRHEEIAADSIVPA